METPLERFAQSDPAKRRNPIAALAKQIADLRADLETAKARITQLEKRP